MLAGCGGGASVERFCDSVADLGNADLAALGTRDTDDPAVRAQLQRISAKFDSVLDASPADIRDDVAVLAGVTAALEDAARATDSRNQFDRAAAVLAALEPFEQDLPGAATRYNDYVTRNCTPAP
ncbi:MAG TPA: hypothetical protein DEP69_02085 [Acidimicrobiaceae bacterium]|nr:hypothetical protein [Acidimicrobiaceae bacterium]